MVFKHETVEESVRLHHNLLDLFVIFAYLGILLHDSLQVVYRSKAFFVLSFTVSTIEQEFLDTIHIWIIQIIFDGPVQWSLAFIISWINVSTHAD